MTTAATDESSAASPAWGAPGREAEEMQYTGDASGEAADEIDGDQVAVDVDAGAAGGFFTAADDVSVAAEFGARQDKGEDDDDQRCNNNWIRQELHYITELLWRQVGWSLEPFKAVVGNMEEQTAIADDTQGFAQFGG